MLCRTRKPPTIYDLHTGRRARGPQCADHPASVIMSAGRRATVCPVSSSKSSMTWLVSSRMSHSPLRNAVPTVVSHRHNRRFCRLRAPAIAIRHTRAQTCRRTRPRARAAVPAFLRQTACVVRAPYRQTSAIVRVRHRGTRCLDASISTRVERSSAVSRWSNPVVQKIQYSIPGASVSVEHRPAAIVLQRSSSFMIRQAS